MTVVHFDFFNQDGQQFEQVNINLLDTNGARAWVYSVLLNSSERTVEFGNNPPARDHLQDKNTLSEIHNTLRSLQNFGYTYPGVFPNILSEVSVEHLNNLHRYFTEAAVDLWAEKTKSFVEITKIDEPLQQLNLLIHKLEGFCPSTKKIDYIKHKKEIILKSNSNAIGFDIKPFRSCHSFEHTDVVIDAYILGKTLLESYLCEDRPDAWDTSGNIRTNGGCVFLLTDYRSQLYHSNEFISWLDQYNCSYNNTYADFPIGNFAPGDKHKAEKLLGLPLYQTSCKISVTI